MMFHHVYNGELQRTRAATARRTCSRARISNVRARRRAYVRAAIIATWDPTSPTASVVRSSVGVCIRVCGFRWRRGYVVRVYAMSFDRCQYVVTQYQLMKPRPFLVSKYLAIVFHDIIYKIA